jgi:aryl-alcohol dehydrogenase-like predicted oxidoreductase
MRYRTLGRTGITVSNICLGTMMMGAWGSTGDDECQALVDLALESGVNFIDTADVYAFGESEELVGRAIKGRRDDLVLATKFGNPMDGDPNHRGNSRRWIMKSIDNSLRRLQTDWIDLYQVHRPDESCDIDETLGALSDLVQQGKVRAIGCSTFPAEQITEAHWVAERNGRETFRCEQPPYSALSRGIESSVLPACMRLGMGVVVWSPLNGGWLSGKYRSGAPAPDDSRAIRYPDHFDLEGPVKNEKLDAVERLVLIAEKAGMPLIQMALAFVLEHPAVTSAIVGPRSAKQLADQLEAGDIDLTVDVLDAIDEVVPPGTNLNPADAGWVSRALEPKVRRRNRVPL